MTARVYETIYYEGKEYGMAAEPLEQYFENLKERPLMEPTSTACWRGYVGTLSHESIYEKDLFLDFENGILTNAYLLKHCF